MNDEVLCLDIGGSSIKSGIFSKSHFAKAKALVRTSPVVEIAGNTFADVQEAAITAVRDGLQSADTDRVGISTTGTVRPDGVVLAAGHFEGYELIDWSSILRAEFPGVKHVKVTNDGKASAWAEFSYYDGGRHSHVHFVLGTGIGSSVVVNGELIDGDSGEAGFLGHTIVTSEPTIMCSCDRHGCLETVASGPGLVFEYNKISDERIGSFAELMDALSAGDTAALKVVDVSTYHFGSILGVLANALNPRLVTFGGGVMLGLREALAQTQSDTYFLDRIKETMFEVAFHRSARTTGLQYAAFDNDGGLIGAGLLATPERL